MSTRNKLTRKGAALVAAAALWAGTAAATEELVVYGTDTADSVTGTEAELRMQMKEDVRVLNQSLKDTLDKDVKRLEAPRLELALQGSLGRG